MSTLDNWAKKAFKEAGFLAEKLQDPPKCDMCNGRVQLIRWFNFKYNEWTASWKCRECGYEWEIE